jgi:hypothetical protein
VNKLLLTAGFIVIVCFNLKCIDRYNTQNANTSYHVYKVDSLNNFYLIYASKQGGKYKIVSEKKHCESGDKILKAGYYEFDLYSIIYNSDTLPIHPGGVGSIQVDSLTTIFLEDSIYDIFSAKNINGLCFLKNK